MHKIYLAAILIYDICYEDPEELNYYKKLRKEMDGIEKMTLKKEYPLLGIFPMEKINKYEYLFIN